MPCNVSVDNLMNALLCVISHFSLAAFKNFSLSLALVNLGCHSKGPQTGCIKKQNFISHSSGDFMSDLKV